MQTVMERPRASTARSSPARKGALGALGSPLMRKPVLGEAGIFAQNGKKELGLAVLTALSIAGLWSAINPSYMTLYAFGSKAEARPVAAQGLWIGLGASLLGAGAIYFVFGDWIPTIAGAVTGVGLFGLGMYAINAKPIESIPSIQNQPIGPKP